MEKYKVIFKAELDLGSLGAPEEVIQEIAQAIKSGDAVDPKTPVTNVEARNGIIFCDFEMIVEATNEQEAITKAQSYIDEQANTPEATPWKTYDFKAKKI